MPSVTARSTACASARTRCQLSSSLAVEHVERGAAEIHDSVTRTPTEIGEVCTRYSISSMPVTPAGRMRMSEMSGMRQHDVALDVIPLAGQVPHAR